MIGKLEQVDASEDTTTYNYRQHEITCVDGEARIDVQGLLVETWSGEGPHWKGLSSLEEAVKIIDKKFETISELLEKDRCHREGDEVLEDGRRVWRGV